MTFELGQTYGGYQFIDIVESSRSGVIYRVRNLAESRFEHLRVLPKAMQEDPERVERFFREAKVRARLTHRNIVSFYHATLIEEQFVMTTEVTEGRTLADRLELGPLPVGEAVEVAIQVLDALRLAHENGVVHRDVSSANLLITPEGVVKLTGFSFARAAGDPRLTQVGAALGEVHYMSPEQVRGVEQPDARSDLYSTGVVLYEMFTGRRPFDSTSQFDIMLAHVHSPPRPPSQWNSQVPVELDTVVLKALAKNPSHRFQSAADFQEALQVPVRSAVDDEPDAPEASREVDPVFTAPAAAREAASVHVAMFSPPEPEAMPTNHEAAGVTEPELGLPDMTFGARELAVLSLGVLAMVTLVMLVIR